MTEWCLPVPGTMNGTISGFMELPDGRFVAVDDRATDEHYALGADLARKRIGRCRAGSTNWHWYRAVIAEDERRQQTEQDLAGFIEARRGAL